MNRLDNFNIILCPTYEIAASQPQPEYSVEAEYGHKYIEGKLETLAHHDDRSDNPAPCNVDVKSYEDVGGTIMLSHIDIDSIGGVMAITGDKPEDKEFWEGAGYIDVAGPHHIHELSQEVQDKLNAIYAWNNEIAEEKRKNGEDIRQTELKDVTNVIREYYNFFDKLLDKTHPEHDEIIEKGRQWEQGIAKETEERCVFENELIRAFKTDGVFCAASYYSPNQGMIIPATVSYNEKYNSITVAFADGGIERGGTLSAREIVQNLWGEEAGGHDGIAGSPRGQHMTEKDFDDAKNVVMDEIIRSMEIERNMDIEKEPSR